VDAAPALPAPVDRAMARYLRLADRLLPGRVVGAYVVGSVALGAFRRERSDIDVIAVVDRRLDEDELRRVRWLQLASGVPTSAAALARGRVTLPGTVNATFVAADDLTKPVTSIVPVASHVGHEFHAGQGFDVNPVIWTILARHGIAVRGPEAATLGLDPEPGALAEWNRSNLERYWRPWGEAAVAARRRRLRIARARWLTAWGVLGPPRLHHTIATGDVISKEAAGEYALDTFDARWHPIIEDGLAYWRGERAPDDRFRDPQVRARATGEFVLEVVASALG
jgi:hypothetical protein